MIRLVGFLALAVTVACVSAQTTVPAKTRFYLAGWNSWSVPSIPPSRRHADFGRRWVREHPYTITALCGGHDTYNIPQYRGAGFTCMLAWKNREGILKPASANKLPWFIHLYSKRSADWTEFQARVRRLNKDYAGNIGFILNDEPILEEMADTGKALEWLRGEYPDRLVMSNLGGDPDYRQHARNFLRLVRPDVLMFDSYPFSPAVDGFDEPDKHFQRIGIVREEALKAGIPYWAFVQSGNRDYFSESNLRMQLFTYLTYGFSGLAYFMYDYWDFKNVPGLINKDHTPSTLYPFAAKANGEVQALGNVIKRLTSTHVFAVPPGPGERPLVARKILPVWRPGVVPDDPIKSVEILMPGPDRYGLLGYFKDDRGGRYLMLTNLYRKHGKKEGLAENTRLSFRVAFASDIKQVSRVSRETGGLIPVPVERPQEGLVVTLSGGTGDLFKF